MTEHSYHFRFIHMYEYTEKAINMANGHTCSALNEDEQLYFALTRLVELVGEAASYVPQNIRLEYPDIPWSKIIGMRNKLIHGYDSIDYNILWDTVTHNFPSLLETLRATKYIKKYADLN